MAEWAAEIEVGEELARTLIGGRDPGLPFSSTATCMSATCSSTTPAR
jgi:hypothetical protein